MTVDETNSYLVTGDADGIIKVWDISEFCRGRKANRNMSPSLLKQFQPHTDTINSIQLFTRSDRLIVLTASSDCAVALWDVEGRYIGIFGQEEHWKIEPISKEERDAERAKELEKKDWDSSNGDEQIEEDDRLDDGAAFADDEFDPEFKVSTWEHTILGKAYQEKRIEKRERRQPHTIPDLPYLNWERTGQLPAGPYASLDTSDLGDVGVIQKPDFVTNPERYFSENSAEKRRGTNTLPPLPSITDNLQMRYDEKSVFPKYILDMEAKMKATHVLGLQASRGTRARGTTGDTALQTKTRVPHDGSSGKKTTSWKVLLAKDNYKEV